jgi:hypothetical protein
MFISSLLKTAQHSATADLGLRYTRSPRDKQKQLKQATVMVSQCSSGRGELHQFDPRSRGKAVPMNVSLAGAYDGGVAAKLSA